MAIQGQSEEGQEGLGPELEKLLAVAPPPRAPPWFAAKTLARLRNEEAPRHAFWLLRWRWAWVAGASGVVAGWMLWQSPKAGSEISDAEVFAALDALVEQDAEARWWTGL